MNINYEKIREIYGESVIKSIEENSEEINKNINYLLYLGFSDIEDIFERETLLFLYDYEIFKNKIDFLINKLGADYAEIIENNIGLLEELL